LDYLGLKLEHVGSVPARVKLVELPEVKKSAK